MNILFLHTMPGYCYLTQVWDNSILHPCCTCANVILSYQTIFYDKNMKTAKKLPLNTNIFTKNPDDTFFFHNYKRQQQKYFML